MVERFIIPLVLAGIAAFLVIPSASAQALKTAAACNAEYKADKAALKTAKEKKRDFVSACRVLPPGTPTPIGTAAAAPGVAPPPAAPQQTDVPRPAAVPATPATRATASRATVAPTGAYQFAAEASAKARCQSATVVWVNTKSKLYHFAGTKNYGNTKAGSYMCEGDATAAGDRASKREKHP